MLSRCMHANQQAVVGMLIRGPLVDADVTILPQKRPEISHSVEHTADISAGQASVS